METFSALLALCVGNSPVIGEFPSQMPVARSFDVFFDLRLSKQSRHRWFETSWHSLWRHGNEYITVGGVLPGQPRSKNPIAKFVAENNFITIPCMPYTCLWFCCACFVALVLILWNFVDSLDVFIYIFQDYFNYIEMIEWDVPVPVK